MSDTLTAPDGTTVIVDKTFKDNGDYDLFSHYVKHEDLEAAMLEGKPALALCGKKWLPTKDATRFPVCPECKDKWETLSE